MTSIQQRYAAGADVALVAFFLMLINLPLVMQVFFGAEKEIPEERRLLRHMPRLRLDTWTIKEFPRLFEGCYSDHFRLRRQMVRAHHLAKLSIFNDSPCAAVVLGKDGWLFYDGKARNDGDPIADYRGTRPMTGEQCFQWEAVTRARASWLASRNVRYVFVVAPNKETIYSEYMPDCLRPLSTNSPMNQLTGYASGIANLWFMDIRHVLKKASGSHQVYSKTDTHWNSYGAFVAYDAIMRLVSGWFPAVAVRTRDDFTISYGRQRGGDLAGLLALSDHLVEPAAPVFCSKSFVSVNPLPGRPASDEERCTESSDLPTAVVFHDSFGMALIPFLTPHFGRIVFRGVGEEFDKALIDNVKPQLVVTILCERNLRGICTPSPPGDEGLVNRQLR
ncbi:MAG: hypothetical protein A2283_23375 [Lentisphaerae bacterium RIFOXYA12_FULL_48_11]|nr:MAG: hypothetical protein A2283_23375 [Lentisphaerae bacterium RIFOXYA12_FULL_48_11]